MRGYWIGKVGIFQKWPLNCRTHCSRKLDVFKIHWVCGTLISFWMCSQCSWDLFAGFLEFLLFWTAMWYDKPVTSWLPNSAINRKVRWIFSKMKKTICISMLHVISNTTTTIPLLSVPYLPPIPLHCYHYIFYVFPQITCFSIHVSPKNLPENNYIWQSQGASIEVQQWIIVLSAVPFTEGLDLYCNNKQTKKGRVSL